MLEGQIIVVQMIQMSNKPNFFAWMTNAWPWIPTKRTIWIIKTGHGMSHFASHEDTSDHMRNCNHRRLDSKQIPLKSKPENAKSCYCMICLYPKPYQTHVY